MTSPNPAQQIQVHKAVFEQQPLVHTRVPRAVVVYRFVILIIYPTTRTLMRSQILDFEIDKNSDSLISNFLEMSQTCLLS